MQVNKIKIEKKVEVLEIVSSVVDEYWNLYEKIYEQNSPLTYNQKANLLLYELRKMK